MGKKIRIVLLSVTAVAAVFSFASMLAVRPGSDSTVLDAARERQSQPLLSVAEPLETDVDVLTAEEEMAEKVKALLASDEEFLQSVSDSIYDGVPELVSTWLAGDEASVILRTLQDNGVDEAVRRIVTEENINAVAERVAENLGTDESAAYTEASARLVNAVAGSIIIPELQRRVTEDAIIRLYQQNKAEIADDVIDRAIAGYEALSAEEKVSLLSLDSLYGIYGSSVSADAIEAFAALPAEEKARIISFAETADRYYYDNLDNVVSDIREALGPAETVDVEAEVLALYGRYRPALVSDMVMDILARYDALSQDEKKDIIGIDAEDEVLALYDKHKDALAEDVAAYIAGHYPLEEAILALYDKYRPALTADIISGILDEYDALSAEGKAELLGLDAGLAEEDILALYSVYRAALAEDVIAYWNEHYPAEPADTEAEILALYEKYRDGLAEDVIAYASEHYPAEAIDVEAAVLALYDMYRDDVAADVLSRLDIASEAAALYEDNKDVVAEDVIAYASENHPADAVDVEAEVLSLYDQYRTALADDIASYLRDAYPLDIEDDVRALYEANRDAVAEDIAGYIQENYPDADIDEAIASYYDQHKQELAEYVAAYIAANYPPEKIDARAEAEAVFAEHRDELAADIAEALAERTPKEPITPPSFPSGAMLPEGAGRDEYRQVRSDVRASEAERFNAFFAQ